MAQQILLIVVLIGCAAVLLTILIRIIRTFSPSVESQKDLLAADGYEKLGRTEEALRAYRKSLESDPSNVEAVKGMCLILLRNDDRPAAISVLQEFCEWHGDASVTELHETLRLLRANDVEEAVRKLRSTWL